jgi:putative membrane protein
MHSITAVYCYTLPFGVVDAVKLYTPVVVHHRGLRVLRPRRRRRRARRCRSEQEPNDLPLEAMSRLIEHNLRQSLGETDAPPLKTPVGDVLD